MYQGIKLKAPFFEIGPKNYLVGDEILKLAEHAEKASLKYDVQIVFTTPFTEIRRVSENFKNLLVFAPHIDPIQKGRGLADILAEAVKDAGAVGTLLNHAEKPLTFDNLKKCIDRANEVGLLTLACANTIAEAKAIAYLNPDIIVAEPTELIGTGQTSDMSYVTTSIEEIRSVNKDIFILQGAGISNGKNVYDVIKAGSDATGSSSGIVKAKDMLAMVDEMISAARTAYDERIKL